MNEGAWCESYSGEDYLEIHGDDLPREQVRTEVEGVVRFIRGEFDAAIYLYTAFGYFEDPADDPRTLEGVRRALAPGGRFLLETIHRDALPARFQSRAWDETWCGGLDGSPLTADSWRLVLVGRTPAGVAP